MTRRAALLVLLLNAGVSALMIALYEHSVGPVRSPAFAVLDVAELYRLKEREVATVLMKAEAREDERLAALQRAQSFGTELTALIQGLPGECRCLVIVRGALVGSAEALPDLTPGVRQRLGL